MPIKIELSTKYFYNQLRDKRNLEMAGCVVMDAVFSVVAIYLIIMCFVIGMFFVILFIFLIPFQTYHTRKKFMYGKYRIIVDEIAWARESSDAWGDVGCKYLQTNVEAVLRGDYVINEPVYVIQKSNGKCICGYCARYYSIAPELFGVLTGCLRISSESIFTGMNNFKVDSITKENRNESFGFTESEVDKMLSYYDISERKAEAKEWYDGYRFGKSEIYCPWDVVNFCHDINTGEKTRAERYWINSSANSLVREFVDLASEKTKGELENLVNGEKIRKNIKEELTYRDIDNTIENLWSILYLTGYLTGYKEEDNKFVLWIPNREIREIYITDIEKWFGAKVRRDSESGKQFINAALSGQPREMIQILNRLLMKMVSIRDSFTRENIRENFYHGFVLGLLYEFDGINSNSENGDGYSDITIVNDNKGIVAILELKYSDSGEPDQMSAACDDALQQIDDKHYADDYLFAGTYKKNEIVYLDISDKAGAHGPHGLVAGTTGSGKSEVLQTYILSLCTLFHPYDVGFVIIDFKGGSMVLKIFEGSHHVGGVVLSSETEKCKNLFKLLQKIIVDRKKILSSKGIGSFSAYLEAGNEDMPEVVVIIDNFAAFKEYFPDETEEISSIVREAQGVGLSFIITAQASNAMNYRVQANFGTKFILNCNDTNEYSNFFGHTKITPKEVPGRGLLMLEKRILEFQTDSRLMKS